MTVVLRRLGIPSDRLLGLVVGVSLAVKVLMALTVGATAEPVLDERAYLALADGLAGGEGFSGTFRPPLYPAFVALFLMSGLGTTGVLLAQAVLSTITVVLVYRIAERAFDPTVARVASAVFAVDPVVVAFTHRLWSETLYLVLFLAAVDIALRVVREDRWMPWVVAGALFGAAGLTRPMVLTFLPLLLPWLWWHARGARTPTPVAWRRVLVPFVLVGVTSSAVVLPWTVRNLATTGAFILVDSNGPFNVLVGNQPEAMFVDKDDNWSWRFGRVDGEAYVDLVVQDAGRAQDLAMQAARRHIAESPGRFVRKAFWEAGHLFTMDSFLLRHLRNDWYGFLAPRSTFALVTIVAATFFVVLMVTATIGAATAPASPLRGLTLLLVGHSVALFSLTYALSRYSVPLRPMFAIFAAMAIVEWRRHGARFFAPLRVPARGLAVGAVLLFFATAWVRDLPLMWSMVTQGGESHRFRMELPDDTAGTPDGERT